MPVWLHIKTNATTIKGPGQNITNAVLLPLGVTRKRAKLWRHRYSYNSCGDRHCPKCQAAKQAFWIDDLIHSTLPVKHYHMVFTVPHQLNAVCLHNQRMYYDLLFDAVWNTLRSFGYSHFGAETGAICVLHTWGQNLSLHPHIHCIVPAAGYTLNGQWKNIGHSWNYLYPVHQLSDAFKGRFLDSLKRALRKKNELALFNDKIQQAYNTRWVVHCEPRWQALNMWLDTWANIPTGWPSPTSVSLTLPTVR